MFQRYLNFVRGVALTSLGRIGVILTTSSFIIFLLFQFANLLGALTNAYIGLIIYLVMPTLFVLGLILIPIGWYRYKKTTGKSAEEILSERFSPEEIRAQIFGSRLALTIVILTVVNILFLGAASLRMLHFMDTPVFCGTACHKVMNPEWTVYQVSPHASVACVQCHVGEGFSALIDSKLNGMWQIISATFDLYERPIPTPVHQLRPARETCEKCHWPEKFYGNRLKHIVHYDFDQESTPRFTTLNLKVDTEVEVKRSGIHWHIGKGRKILYTSVNDEREEMLVVKYISTEGEETVYYNSELEIDDKEPQEFREMDCVDCHNRATHIYEDPDDGIDRRIRRGLLSRKLPFIKKVAYAAIIPDYPTIEAAMIGIENEVQGFYQRNYPEVWIANSREIEKAVAALQEMYRINIHPRMNVRWNSYPNHIGHAKNGGCFRCHNKKMVTQERKQISHDCTMCHSILSNNEKEPFRYIKPLDKKDPNYPMHLFLQDEFYNYFNYEKEKK